MRSGSTHRILCIVGTRPEIIKMAPVIEALDRCPAVQNIVVHSGQHYERELSEIFFKELGVRQPDTNLDVGSGTHASQIAEMLKGFEQVVDKIKPDLVLAEGDTNTVLAASLVSTKLRVPFGHIEAGLRCYDRTMPEETNRVVADALSELCFAPTEISAINLIREGILPSKISITGNTIVDICRKNVITARKSKILTDLGLHSKKSLALVTIHRPENVDDQVKLRSIVRALQALTEFTFVFPVHPRTRQRLEEMGLYGVLDKSQNVILSPPLGYLDFLNLLSNSAFVLTDSGGVQEEALTLRRPCLTLRRSTERPETVSVGANILVGTDPGRIAGTVRTLATRFNDFEIPRSFENPLGDGRAGARIARICARWCQLGRGIDSADHTETGVPTLALLRVAGAIDGKLVEEVENLATDIVVSCIFDHHGRPVLPTPDLVLRKGWQIQVFAGSSSIDMTRRRTCKKNGSRLT